MQFTICVYVRVCLDTQTHLYEVFPCAKTFAHAFTSSSKLHIALSGAIGA